MEQSTGKTDRDVTSVRWLLVPSLGEYCCQKMEAVWSAEALVPVYRTVD